MVLARKIFVFGCRFLIWSSNNPHKTGSFIFTWFTIFVLICGTWIVCLTLHQQNRTCQWKFQRSRKSSIISSSRPRSIAAGDFNNDNRMDIVVANSGSDTIGVLLMTTKGTFTDQKTYPTGSHSLPYSVTVNHFNNDRNVDIAVANYGTNNIGIFYGYGNGIFSNQVTFSTDCSRPFFITSGDINNDHQIDIVIANHNSDSISILQGNDDGSSRRVKTFSTGYDSRPYSIAIHDLNGDRNVDLVVANYGTHNIGILLGLGNGDFERLKIYTTNLNSYPCWIALADFNGDHFIDILVTNNGTGNLGILFGLGDGSFAAQIIYSIGDNFHPYLVAVGDFNKDKQIDVVAVDTQKDQLQIILQFGNSSSSIGTAYRGTSISNTLAMVVADFDNDDQSDIAIANYGTNDILVLTGFHSTLTSKQTDYLIQSLGTVTCLVIGDFNNDHYLDIVSNGFSKDDLILLAGNRDGTFTREKVFSAGYNSDPTNLFAIDLNNDKLIDIVTANIESNNIGVILGSTNDLFANVTLYSTGISSSPIRIAINDMNNDGYLDIVCANSQTHSVGILLGHGDGTFASTVLYSVGTNNDPGSLALGDLNNDGYLDIVTANYVSRTISLLYGNSKGMFQLVSVFSTECQARPTSISLVDINNDSYLDIVIATDEVGYIGVFLGSENGHFLLETSYSIETDSPIYHFVIDDFNHDNQLDVIVALLSTDEIAIYYGHSNRSFQLARRLSTGYGSRPCYIALADFDDDKRLDFAVGLWQSVTVAVINEYFTASFKNEMVYSTGSVPSPYSLVITDLNNNNLSDIIICNSATDRLRIGFDFDHDQFKSYMLYSTGPHSQPRYVTTGDVNNDGYEDIIIINNSQSNRINIIINYGNNSFAEPITYLIENDSHPSAVIVLDFNNDHRRDLLIVNEGTDSIGMFFGYDYSTYESPRTYRHEKNLIPQSIKIADFNNDNYLDVSVTFIETGHISILLGTGDGNFGTMINHSLGMNSRPFGHAVGDLNNDGKMDVAVADIDADKIIVLFGYGNGSFSNMILFFTGNKSLPIGITIADLNSDGWLDIVVANSDTHTIGILCGYGNGTFANMIMHSIKYGSAPVAVLVNDVDKDNQADLIVINRNYQNVEIFLGYDNGCFRNRVAYDMEQDAHPWSAAVADLNSDGILDIVVVMFQHDKLGVLFGYGNGTFRNMVSYWTGIGSKPRYVTVADMNNDSYQDIVVANYGTNNVIIYFGSKHGILYQGRSHSVGDASGPICIAVADFNNDGRQDFVVSNAWSRRISVFLGYGNELYGDLVRYEVGSKSKPRAAAIGDFNNDGNSDLVIVNYGADNICVLLGNGFKDFDSIVTYSTDIESGPCSVAVADLNNDTYLDIAVTNCNENSLLIFLGFGNGTFIITSKYSTGDRSQPTNIAIADFNNNHVMDIAVVNFATSNIFVLFGRQNGLFENQESYPLGYNYHPNLIAISDLNQDGWMDIIIGCHNTDDIEILMLTCS